MDMIRSLELHLFVLRANDEYKEIVEKNQREKLKKNNERREKNPEIHKSWRKKFEQSEKGKEATLRKSLIRRERFRRAKKGLSKEEKLAIDQFYGNIPEGFEVDHIVPIACGGLHRMNNLQYVLPCENQKKGAREDFVFTKFIKAPEFIKKQKIYSTYGQK